MDFLTGFCYNNIKIIIKLVFTKTTLKNGGQHMFNLISLFVPALSSEDREELLVIGKAFFIFGLPIMLVFGILLTILWLLPMWIRTWRMRRLAQELNCHFFKKQTYKMKGYRFRRRNIIQGIWHGKSIIIYDVRCLPRLPPETCINGRYYNGFLGNFHITINQIKHLIEDPAFIRETKTPIEPTGYRGGAFGPNREQDQSRRGC